MKTRNSFYLAILTIFSIVLLFLFYEFFLKGSGMIQGIMGSKNRQSMEVPSVYRTKSNPLLPEKINVTEGQELYMSYCMGCHGTEGKGDGPAGTGLDPKPGDLGLTAKMGLTSDPYLYWTIADGGAAVKSAMPPFRKILESEQIWKIILHLQTL